MNIFLRELSATYPDDYIVLVADGAGWHTSKDLIVPNNVEILSLPPYTPEMNPIEQIWAWIRRHGFRNEVFASLDRVVDRLCDTICALTHATVSSITFRNWMLPMM
jgi:putative transposase